MVRGRRGAPNSLSHREHICIFHCLFSHDSPQLANPQGAAQASLSRSVHVLKEAVGVSKSFKDPDNMFISFSLFPLSLQLRYHSSLFGLHMLLCRCLNLSHCLSLLKSSGLRDLLGKNFLTRFSMDPHTHQKHLPVL